MNIDKVVEEFRWELRNVKWFGEELEQCPFVTRRSISGQSSCLVTAFAVNEENANALIREEVLRAQELKVELEWKVFSFDLRSLVPRLQSAGFTEGEVEAMVVYDLNAGLEPFEGASSAPVYHITNAEMLADFQTASTAAFDRDCSNTVAQLAAAIQMGSSVDMMRHSHGRSTRSSWFRSVVSTRIPKVPLQVFTGAERRQTTGDGASIGRSVSARARDAKEAGARYLLVGCRCLKVCQSCFDWGLCASPKVGLAHLT